MRFVNAAGEGRGWRPGAPSPAWSARSSSRSRKMAPGMCPSRYAARPAPGLPRYQRRSTMIGASPPATCPASSSMEMIGDVSTAIDAEATAPAAAVLTGGVGAQRSNADLRFAEPAAPAARLAAMHTPPPTRRTTRPIIRPLTRLAGGLALVAILASAGCAGAAATSIGDREFLSVNVTDGGAARPLVPNTRIRLNFSGANLGASAGCNSIGGTYRIEAGRLVFDGGGMTEMGCDQARHDQDDWLAAFLRSKPVARLNGNDLALEGGSVVVTL